MKNHSHKKRTFFPFLVTMEKQKDIFQEQPSGLVLQRKCSKIFAKAYRKTRIQEPFFSEKFRM